MDRKTRKILTIYKSFHPRDDADRLYLKRAEGRRGLQSVEKVVKIEECSLGHYLVQNDEILLKEVITGKIIKTRTLKIRRNHSPMTGRQSS